MDISDQQLLRYNRHIMLAGFDIDGQEKLLGATVLIVGLGGLGCPVALYLASSGVGHLILADHDQVDLSNLQRQIAHSTADIGSSKVASAAATIQALNPEVRISAREEKLQGDALVDAIAQADLVVDCSDSFATRFAINKVCWQQEKPLVSGAAIRGEGQVIAFDARSTESPCYRCLYSDATDEENLSCAQSGVLAPLVGVIGALQAMMVVKLISGYGEVKAGQLWVFDGKYGDWRQLTVPKASACPICST